MSSTARRRDQHAQDRYAPGEHTMSQRVDKGPKFRPNIPIRRPGAAPAAAPSASAAGGPQRAPSQRAAPSGSGAAAASQNGDGEPSSGRRSAHEAEETTLEAQDPASSQNATQSSSRPSSIRAPSQIVAAGLRLTPRGSAITPGQSSQSGGRAAIGAPVPRSGPAPVTVGRPQPRPANAQPRDSASTSGTQRTARLQANTQASGADSEDEEHGDNAEAALLRDAIRNGNDDEGGGDSAPEQAEAGPSSRTQKGRVPRAKKLTIDEEEATYEEQEAQLDETRRPDEDISMTELSRYEVRSGRASKRTFDMMRKHEAYKQDLKNERDDLIGKLLRKRQAGLDWNDKFGSDEEEAAEDEKRRKLRKQRKKRANQAGEDKGSDENDAEDLGNDEDDDDGDAEDGARILAREAGQDDSDDGQSMTSEEGSDDDEQRPSPGSRSQANRKGGKDSALQKGAKGRKKGPSVTLPPLPPADSGSSSESDSEDDVYGESQAAVQIRLGPDGRPVLSESSLTVDPTKLADVIDAGVEGVTSVIETERFINSSTRGKKAVNARWAKEETESFYRAISQWGTDFEMIARLFPTRSRHQIKLKFSREEKQNPDRVNQAFKTRIPVDLEAYGIAVGRNLSGPLPKVSVKKPDEYLKMEEQERLLQTGGDMLGARAQEQAGSSSGPSRRTQRGSSADRRRSVSAGAGTAGGEQQSEGEDGAALSGGDDHAGPPSASRRSGTPGAGRRRSGSNAGSQSASGRSTQRRGYDRERDRERAKALAEEQRKERERLHRAGSGRGGGVAYESQEMVLGDADDI